MIAVYGAGELLTVAFSADPAERRAGRGCEPQPIF